MVTGLATCHGNSGTNGSNAAKRLQGLDQRSGTRNLDVQGARDVEDPHMLLPLSPPADALRVRVVHLGRSTCHAIRGQGISQLSLPKCTTLTARVVPTAIRVRENRANRLFRDL